MSIGLRLITGIEFVVYGTLSTVSGWFPDHGGYGGHDPLADPSEVQLGGVFSGQHLSP
jgi:hypothetical protein